MFCQSGFFEVLEGLAAAGVEGAAAGENGSGLLMVENDIAFFQIHELRVVNGLENAVSHQDFGTGFAYQGFFAVGNTPVSFCVGVSGTGRT